MRQKQYTLEELCRLLSISEMTGNNWVRLKKIVPTGWIEGKPFFSEEGYASIREHILQEDSKRLKSRRNKNYVEGNGLYRSYLSRDSENADKVRHVLKLLGEEKLSLGQQVRLLADCAGKLAHQAAPNTERAEELRELVEELKRAARCGKREQSGIAPLLEEDYSYETEEDVLGLLYLSLKQAGARKQAGVYYTPTLIVRKLVKGLAESGAFAGSDSILDPCCGTGNFLIQLPGDVAPERILGMDIDKISVLLARINLALKYPGLSPRQVRVQVRVRDFLKSMEKGAYGCVLGNPPWGYEFTESQRQRLRERYASAGKGKVESYDVFLEQALQKTKAQGRAAFVLPEAILNVKGHQGIRDIVAEGTNIERLDYLGNVFDRVQCPAIILQLQKTGQALRTQGMEVSTLDGTFQIMTERKPDPANFNFHIPDRDYLILEKLDRGTEVTCLKGQAAFALGIVTGDNEKHISTVPWPGKEYILKGADIYRYGICPEECYIEFEPEKFQQCAPAEYYRAPEKLLYRFVCGQLVFAYDDRQMLSLNSCNLVIPRIRGMEMKYILAVLNSRIAQFYFQKKFHSVKILRAHVEQIPIPVAEAARQQELVLLAEGIRECRKPEERRNLYGQADRKVAELFGLEKSEYARIYEETEEENLFLTLPRRPEPLSDPTPPIPEEER